MTVKEASQKWGMSEDRIRKMCGNNEIPNVKKVSGVWVIPENAEKPAKVNPPETETKDDGGLSNGAMFGLIALGIVLSLLGGNMIINSHIFFGIIFLLIGSGILTLFCRGFLPKVKDEVILAGIAAIAVFCSMLLFGLGDFASSGRSWGDLSDVEKENAKWAYEANQYIDSLD